MDTPATDFSGIPQISASNEENEKRMQWFRDAKFGMFIHWGPCTIGQKEIGWGREANRPWDINQHGERSDDPEYDNYYKEFNPVNYDPDAWAAFAKASGMKYMVLVTKHHDGFSMFDTKLSNYSIMNTPYGQDIVGPFVKACQKHGLKAGLYYSTRDWYHPEYLVGDNVAYDEWYRGQVEELLTNYGQVDMMWYDHVGGQDWSKWKFGELFSMMYRCQPHLLVNNRAAKFCGPSTPDDQGPASPELEKLTLGDFYTPEGKIGAMDIEEDWESCIHVGQGWSYRGEEGFKGPEQCIKMLVSCTTGGGNLLLNFGPKPDGTFAGGETKVAEAAGAWLAKYGEAIYGTRGGPYDNGHWGGSCHKGHSLFLHVYAFPEEGPLHFDGLPREILTAETLDGHAVEIRQEDDALYVGVDPVHRNALVTVIKLTLDQPVEAGTHFGHMHSEIHHISDSGELISRHAAITISSSSEYDDPEDHFRLTRGPYSNTGYAFHTADELNPWVELDLGADHTVQAVVIENRPGDQRSEGLIVSVSSDGREWAQVWQAGDWDERWVAEISHFHAGIEVPGHAARYVRLELDRHDPAPLMLQRVSIYGT